LLFHHQPKLQYISWSTMMVFLPANPGDLIEKIAIFNIYDPANPLLPVLVEREHDLYQSNKHGDVRTFLEQLATLKTQMIIAQSVMRQAKHDLFAAAMAPSTTSTQYQSLIKDFKVADQEIITIKASVDRLVQGIEI
jgi:hypothetical protein